MSPYFDCLHFITIVVLLRANPSTATELAPSEPQGNCSLAERLYFLHLFFPVDSTADVLKCPSDEQKETELPTVESQNETLELTDDEPLQSFDEWTRRKLEERRPVVTDTVAKANGAPAAAAPIAARNYASKDCGAKVMLANVEAQNPSALLKDKDNDEYMLNPCETDGPKWFIVELCETVQISCVEMANFELFSSSPKEFRVLTSERYPSSEWHLLGEWTAADSRQIQRYVVASKLYAKYIKVELLSHYGSEHFCPLSLIRVLGISMVEEYEAEAMKHEVFQSPSGEQSGATLNDSEEQNASAKESVLNKASFVFKVVTTTTDQQQQRYADNGGAAAPLSPSAPLSTNGYAVASSSSSYWSCLLSPKNQSKRFTSRHCYFTQLMLNRFAMPAGSPIPLRHVDSERPSTVEGSDTFSSVDTRRFAKYGNRSSHGYCSSDKSELLRHLTMKSDQPKWCPLKSNLTRTKFKRRRLIPTVGYPQPLNSSSEESFASKQAILSGNGGAATLVSTLPLLPGSSTSAKESVFIRLNNRIKQLEINISLSSQYLSELSRTYKRQMEEMQKNLNRTLSLVAETERRLLSMIEVNNDLLYSLKSRVDEVSSMVTSVRKISVPVPDKWWQWHSGLFFMELCLASCIVLFTVLGSKSTSRIERSDVAKVVMDVLMSEMPFRPQRSCSQNSDDVRRVVSVRSSASSVASNKSSRALTNVNGKGKVFLFPKSDRTLRKTDPSARKRLEPQRLRCFSGQRQNANSLAEPNDSPSSTKDCCRSCPGVLFSSSVPRSPAKTEISKWIVHPGTRAPSSKGHDREIAMSPGFLCHLKTSNRLSPSPHG